jgi:CheY-like chemotaxis protein
MPMPRILLVDDDADSLESLKTLLGLMGHQVLAFPDARSALAGVAPPTQRFDLALLDIGLPSMDGCELARQLRTLPAAEGAVLVALTGMHDQGGRAAEAGFDHILIKPVHLPRLQALLGEASRA